MADYEDIKGADEDPRLRCGWYKFRPQCCQVFRNAKILLAVLCCISMLQGLIVNGLVNISISTLERRFDLTSTQAGFIASVYDVASLLCMIPVGYFGGLGAKPRWLGFGAFVMGVGAIIFSSPHYAVTPYNYELTVKDGEGLCLSNSTAQCDVKDSSLSNYRHILNLGQFLHGVGAAPLYTLGYTLIDENVVQSSSGTYISIFKTLAILGPAIGYLFGGYLLTVFTDFHSVDTATLSIDTNSEVWVGAWWIGFLMAGILLLPVAVLMCAFPRELPSAKRVREEHVSEAYNGEESVETLGQGLAAIKDLPKAARVLLKNPTFIFVSMGLTAEVLLAAGFSTFIPKYLENQFSVPASKAAIYVGIAVISAGCLGTIAGGGICRYFQLKVRGMLRMCILTGSVIMLLIFCFFARCPSVDLAGVNHDYISAMEPAGGASANQEALGAVCNQNCSCDWLTFDPVCGDNNITYFSPCAAGCETKTSDEEYTNCTCVAASGGSATIGRCDQNCDLMNVFLPFFAVTIFFTFLSSVPTVMATLRCVPGKQRAFATALQWVMVRCLGSIPGPIIFGAVIDHACLLWGQNCDGSQASCQFYDNNTLSRNFMLISLGVKTISLLSFFVACCVYKAPAKNSEKQELVHAVQTKPNEPGIDQSNSDKPSTDHLPAIELNDIARTSRLDSLNLSFDAGDDDELLNAQEVLASNDAILSM